MSSCTIGILYFLSSVKKSEFLSKTDEITKNGVRVRGNGDGRVNRSAAADIPRP